MSAKVERRHRELAWSAAAPNANQVSIDSFLTGDWDHVYIQWARIAQALADIEEAGFNRFAFRCFRNRNLHLRFKRLDLLDRLNKIAGGRRLRGG